jgi:hypothetical protein
MSWICQPHTLVALGNQNDEGVLDRRKNSAGRVVFEADTGQCIQNIFNKTFL